MTERNAPAPRAGHTAVWTGREMIVWGGDGSIRWPWVTLNSGGQYDPKANRWRATGMDQAPTPRSGHRAVWTGGRMLVFGGKGNHGMSVDHAAYDPVTRRWSPLSAAQAPSPRSGHVVAWTGSGMLVWGGRDGKTPLGDGGRYDPVEDRWTPIARQGAPSARSNASSVWTGTEWLVWGGRAENGPVRDGAAYDPATDRWRPLPLDGAPDVRRDPANAWTGSEWIVWGGRSVVDDSPISNGAAYSPARQAWRPLPFAEVPAHVDSLGVWTGEEFLLVGEAEGDSEYPPRQGALFRLRDGRVVSFVAGWGWLDGTVVWTGTSALFWGGFDGTNLVSRGVRITPAK